MKRIIVLLKKDLKDYWIVPVLMVAFVLLIYFLPTLFSPLQSGETTLGVYGEELPDLANVNVKIKEYSSEESAMDALRSGEVDCLYTHGTLYGTRSNENELRYLATLLSLDPYAAQGLEPEPKIKDVEINSVPPGFILLPMLLPLIMLMGSFIGALALIGDERDKRIIDAIMLTPITYREYVLEKAIIVFASTLIVPVFFLFLTGFETVELILIIILQSAFFTLLFLSITFAFPSVESAVAVSMPIVIFMPVLDLSGKMLSMGSMFYRTMILEESADIMVIVLFTLVLLLFFICTATVRLRGKRF